MSESLTELSRLLLETKLAITELNGMASEKIVERDDYERRLIAALNAVELNSIRNDYGTFSLKESVVPSEIDWELFHNWIIKNNALHMLHRRVSNGEYAKLIEMGEEVPGITPFKKVTVGTRKPANT